MTAEEFRRQLLEETLRSLIRDPSRWTPEDARSFGDASLRARSRLVHNRCSGWMCGRSLEAPLPPGQYCSAECKHRTFHARQAFRRDLHKLRSGLVRQCQCGKLFIPRRVTMVWCSEPCKRRAFNFQYYREHSSHAPLYLEEVNAVCQGRGTQLSDSRQRRHARWCSSECSQRVRKRAAYQRERQRRLHGWKPRKQAQEKAPAA